MQTLASKTTEQTNPPPSAGGKPNGGAAAFTGAAMLADSAEHKRLVQIQTLGKRIQSKERTRDRQLTKVAEIKADLDKERETLNAQERDINDEKAELVKISSGGFSERLGFETPQDDKSSGTPKDDALADDAWRPFTLAELGVKGALKTNLESVGVKNHGDLADAFVSGKINNIGGVGDGAKSKLNELMATWWEKHPEHSKAAEVKPAKETVKALVPPQDVNPFAGVKADRKTWETVKLADVMRHAGGQLDSINALADAGIGTLGELESRYARGEKPDMKVPPGASAAITAAIRKWFVDDAATSPARCVVTLADLGLTHDQVRVGYYPMMTMAKDDARPYALREAGFITQKAPNGPDTKWIAFTGTGDADYRLLPLLAMDDAGEGTGTFFGRVVNVDGAMMRIGPDEKALFVKLGEEKQVAPTTLTKAKKKSGKKGK